MTTVEAAQKWAEAKDTLGAASTALQIAQAAYTAALEVERDAWIAMADLAGRVQPDKMTVEIVPQQELAIHRARMNGGVIERE